MSANDVIRAEGAQMTASLQEIIDTHAVDGPALALAVRALEQQAVMAEIVRAVLAVQREAAQ